jgi:hypothetical protein
LPPVFHHTFSQQTLQAVLPTFFIIFLPVGPKQLGSWEKILKKVDTTTEFVIYENLTHTVIRFISVSAEFGTCTVVSVKWTLI